VYHEDNEINVLATVNGNLQISSRQIERESSIKGAYYEFLLWRARLSRMRKERLVVSVNRVNNSFLKDVFIFTVCVI